MSGSLFIFIIIFGVIVVFAITGIIILVSVSSKKKNCTVSVPATVIQIIEEDGGVNEYSGIKVYRPVFRYIYNEQEYIFRNPVAKTSFKGLQNGMTVNLLINPEKPNEAIFVLN